MVQYRCSLAATAVVAAVVVATAGGQTFDPENCDDACKKQCEQEVVYNFTSGQPENTTLYGGACIDHFQVNIIAPSFATPGSPRFDDFPFELKEVWLNQTYQDELCSKALPYTQSTSNDPNPTPIANCMANDIYNKDGQFDTDGETELPAKDYPADTFGCLSVTPVPEGQSDCSKVMFAIGTPFAIGSPAREFCVVCSGFAFQSTVSDQYYRGHGIGQTKIPDWVPDEVSCFEIREYINFDIFSVGNARPESMSTFFCPPPAETTTVTTTTSSTARNTPCPVETCGRDDQGDVIGAKITDDGNLTAGSCRYNDVPGQAPFIKDGKGICVFPKTGETCADIKSFAFITDSNPEGYANMTDCSAPAAACNDDCDPENFCVDDSTGQCYLPQQDDAKGYCVPAVNGVCFPGLKSCLDERKTACLLNSDGGASEDEIQADLALKMYYDCPADECTPDSYIEGEVPCRIRTQKEGEYLCYSYKPAGQTTTADSIIGGTPILYDDQGIAIETSGPQCYPGFDKCKPWLNFSTTTTTPTKTTSTRTAATTTLAPAGLEQNRTKDLIDGMVAVWEREYCFDEATATERAPLEQAMAEVLQEVNERAVTNFLTNSHHYTALIELAESALADTDLMNYEPCAADGEVCTCQGLVSRAPFPTVSWGAFNCSAETFAGIAPSPSNPTAACSCLDFSSGDAARPNALEEVRLLFEYSRQVGFTASRTYAFRGNSARMRECPSSQSLLNAEISVFCAEADDATLAKVGDCSRRNQREVARDEMHSIAEANLLATRDNIFVFGPGLDTTYEYSPELRVKSTVELLTDPCSGPNVVDGLLCDVVNETAAAFSIETPITQRQHCSVNSTKDVLGLCAASCDEIDCVSPTSESAFVSLCEADCNSNQLCKGIVYTRSANDEFAECNDVRLGHPDVSAADCAAAYTPGTLGAVMCTTLTELDVVEYSKNSTAKAMLSFRKVPIYVTPETTPTVTEVSTGTSTVTSSGSSTPTITVSTTPTTTATTSMTTTGTSNSPTSSVSTTASVTATTTPDSTGTSTFTSTPSSTASLTETLTATSTVSASASSTATTTGSSTLTTVQADYSFKLVYSSGPDVTGPQRRFGNAFSKMHSNNCSNCDRLFVIRGTVESKSEITETAQAKCLADRACHGVFVWKQATHAQTGGTNKDGKNRTDSREKQYSDSSYAAAGLSSGGRQEDGVYGNFFSYDTMFSRDTAADEDVDPELEYPNQLQFSDNMAHKIKYALKADFESESWVRVTTCPASVCSFYTGACVHKQTGFCMDEEPGTARCLTGFKHCNDPNTLNMPL
jgi:hypothetical protein